MLIHLVETSLVHIYWGKSIQEMMDLAQFYREYWMFVPQISDNFVA